MPARLHEVRKWLNSVSACMTPHTHIYIYIYITRLTELTNGKYKYEFYLIENVIKKFVFV